MIRLQKLRGLLRANIEIRDARNSLRHTDWTKVRYEIHGIFAKYKWNFKASNLQRDMMKSLFNVISDIHFNVISDKPNFSKLNGECLMIL